MLYCDSNSQEVTGVGESLKEKDPKVGEQPIFPRRSQRLEELGSNEISQVETLYLVEENLEEVCQSKSYDSHGERPGKSCAIPLRLGKVKCDDSKTV